LTDVFERNQVQKPVAPSTISMAKPGPKAPSVAAALDPAELARATALADQARKDAKPWVAQASRELMLLHEDWIDARRGAPARRVAASSWVKCSFLGNFNTDLASSQFGLRSIEVARHLRDLERNLAKPPELVSADASDAGCKAGKGKDALAFVRSHAMPIHLCPAWRDYDFQVRRDTIIHEYSHLGAGVHDEGGYSDPDLLTTAISVCKPGMKFAGDGDVLVRTADALLGFVLNVAGQG
jgi:hypothetical protein